ncbi:MAG: nitroreductase family protein [Streptosporangiaceae bacterium]
MEFGDVIRKRRMVRAFTTDPLDPGVAQRLLTAANRAPSAGFSQGYALLVLDQPEQLRPFWDVLSAEERPSGAPDFDPVTNAPLVIVPMSCKDSYLDRYAQQDKGWADRDESRWPVPYWDIDTGFMALLMLLAAVDEGLGALFFGIPPALIPAMRAEFGVPDAYLPIGAVAVGHPDPDRDQGGSSRVIKRRALDDLVHYGRW